MNLSTVAKDAFYSALEAGIGAGVGYLYAVVFHVKRKVAVEAFMIHMLVNGIILTAIRYYTGGSDGLHHKIHHLLEAASWAIINAIAIAAYRRLNLIGTLGTVIMGSFTVFVVVAGLHTAYNPKHNKGV